MREKMDPRTRSGGRPHDDTDERDLIGQYLDEIGSTPLLTAEEEVDLAQRIEVGLYAAERLRADAADPVGTARRAELDHLVEQGTRAKDRMIRSNLRLVVAAARKRRDTGLSLLDLIQEGNLGLIRAVEKFDYTKGYKFSTYAMWWIRQAMQRGVDFGARSIRLPSYVSGQVAKIERAQRDLWVELEREPSPEELADAADMPVDRILELRDVARTTTSLDIPVGEDGQTLLGELIDGRVTPEVGDVLERGVVASQVREMLATLEPAERRVLGLRFGLADGKPHTRAETARTLELTRGRVVELEQRALDQLRHPEWRSALLALVS
jgi:RNA polymerase primary sigma factor